MATPAASAATRARISPLLVLNTRPAEMLALPSDNIQFSRLLSPLCQAIIRGQLAWMPHLRKPATRRSDQDAPDRADLPLDRELIGRRRRDPDGEIVVVANNVDEPVSE